MDIYQYIRDSRKNHYRTAKALWKTIEAPFSYEYYSNIERGTKFPNIETVLLLCEHLGMNKKKACFLWAMASMPTEESKAFFRWSDDAIETEALPLGPQISLEQTFLVTPTHKRLLESSPLYWEVLSFFAMHEDQSFTLKEILGTLSIPKKDMLKILGELVKHDLLKYTRKKYSHPKTYMHIPNDKEFFKLRNNNLMHTTKQLIFALDPNDIISDRAYRTTVNKKLTPGQVDRVLHNLKFIVSDLLNLQSPLQKHEGIPYTFTVLFSRRNFRKRTNK